MSRWEGVEGSEGAFPLPFKMVVRRVKTRLLADALRFEDKGTKMEIQSAWRTMKGVLRTKKGVLRTEQGVLRTKKGSADDKPL